MTHAELGASHYLRLLALDGGRVPRPDLVLAPRHMAALHAAMRAGLVAACHDLSEGGLAVAAAEMAFAGELGLDLDLARVSCVPLEPGYDPVAVRLFSESCTRWLVEVAPQQAEAFEGCMEGLDLALVGVVSAAPHLRVTGLEGQLVLELGLERLRAAHRGGFQG
jgi:phosphoribosylformylglycinamidine synthase